LVAQEGFDAVEVFFGVDADGVEVGGFDVNGDAVFEEAQLFQALGMFESAGGQGGEALEGGLAVPVEADVLPVWRRGAIANIASIAVVRDGGAGEVEGPAIGGGDDFDGVWVGDVLFRAEDFEGRDLDVGMSEGAEERGEMLGLKQGFVALDVDVDVRVDLLRYGVDAIGAAGEIGGRELDWPVVAPAELRYFFGVGGDDDAIELGAGGSGLVDPREHGAAGDDTKNFTGEPGGGEACGDDAEHSCGLLFAASGIKYDGNWLCRGDRLSSKSMLCRRNPLHTLAV
jgi:hypothetical protein